MDTTLRGLWTIALFTTALGRAAWAQAKAPTVNLEIKGATLADTLKLVHDEVQVDFIIDPRVNQSVKITASVTDKPIEQALRLILNQATNLTFENVDGVYIIKPAPSATTPATATEPPAIPGAAALPGALPGPAAPRVRPANPLPVLPGPAAAKTPSLPGPGAQPGVAGGATGAPVVESKPLPKLLYLKYAYAPGIAVLLENKTTKVRGQALLYSQIDPWAGALSGNGLGGNNQQGFGGTNVFGNNGFGNNSFGGGFGNNNGFGGGFGNNNGFGGGFGGGFGNNNRFGNNGFNNNRLF